MFSRIAQEADVLALCGDLTDYGLPEEAHILVKELSTAKLPTVAVLGNHDFESGKQEEVRDILCDAGVMVLDGDSFETHGIGFAGGRGSLADSALVRSGHEVRTASKRSCARRWMRRSNWRRRSRGSAPRSVSRYCTTHRSRLRWKASHPRSTPSWGPAGSKNRSTCYLVSLVLHGHAHHGCTEGRLGNGVPVYNVSMPLLRRVSSDRPPYRIVEVNRTAFAAA